MGNSNTKTEQKSLRQHVLRRMNDKPGRSAVLLGATGATGKFVLSYLICSSEWNKITIIHRREVDLDEISKKSGISFTDQQKAKVTQYKVDMDKLCENEEAITKNVELFKDHQVTICTLGTTRATAKSADNFRKVDLYMVRDGAILSKKAGIQHFSLLTSKGANENIWSNDWKIGHGLLYLKTKGDAEQAVIEQKLARTSIFRPSFLARDGNTDGMISKLDVKDLAAVIIYDAEGDEIGNGDGDKKNNEEKSKEDVVEKAVFYEADDIDNMLLIARNNFDAVCGGKPVDDKKKEEIIKEEMDKTEQEDKKKEVLKEEVMEEQEKEDDVGSDDVVKKEEEMRGNEDKDEDKDKDKDILPKYEVVEKPKDEEMGRKDQNRNGDNDKDDDYVEVEKINTNKEDDGGNE